MSKPRKGEKTCESCGANVRIDRKIPHPETPQCLLNRTRRDYLARGWKSVGDGNDAARLRVAGYAVEYAPVAVLPSVLRIEGAKTKVVPVQTVESDEAGVHVLRVDGERIDKANGCQYGPYAESRAISVVYLLKGYPIKKAAVLRALVDDPILRSVVEIVLREGGRQAMHAYLDSVRTTLSK
jgi:hypothetical protein